MDPGFFADPDLGFKSPDPDPFLKIALLSQKVQTPNKSYHS